MRKDLQHLFRMNKFPHIWCPGCGNGIVLRTIAQAINESDLDLDRTVIVSGIGCSSRSTGYMNFDTVHTTHGRALAFATGIKTAEPDLNVFVITGDGDATAIGGNHFIHAARRNIDLNVILFNNNIYGMTGGQYSPMTPQGDLATTAPYGNLENNFDIPKLAVAAGATFVGRSTVYHDKLLVTLIKDGIKNRGFSLTEAITMCPVSYGRKNRYGDGADMIEWQKTHTVNVKAAEKLDPDKIKGKYIIGELYNQSRPAYNDLYQAIVEKLQDREV